MKIYNYLYTVNLFKISQYFMYEEIEESPYCMYKSKDFYGATIRTERDLEEYEHDTVLLSIRFKGHGFSDGEFDRLTGIKMDLIGDGDRRMKELDLNFEDMLNVTMDIECKNGIVTMNEVDDAILLLTAHDYQADKTGILTIKDYHETRTHS